MTAKLSSSRYGSKTHQEPLIQGVTMLLVLFVASCFSASAEDGFKLSSLVVPNGISYKVSPVRLTRDVDVKSGTLTVKKVRDKDVSFKKTTSHDTEEIRENRIDRDVTRGNGGKAGVKGGVNWGLIPHGSINIDANVEYRDVTTDHSSQGNITKDNISSHDDVAQRNADFLNDEMSGTYGNSYLTFSVTFKNMDVNETFIVKPPDGILPSITLYGLSQPITVTYDERKSFTIGLDPIVCNFKFVIRDENLLNELKRRADSDGVIDVEVVISGTDFPIISTRTGKNILQEIKLAALKNPCTEIGLEFGEAAVLSPWKVKQKYGRTSGRRGELVTVRDALLAINEVIAQDDAMPEMVFQFDASSNMICIGENKIGVIDAKQAWVAINTGNGNIIRSISSDFLNKPLQDFDHITFYDLRKEMEFCERFWKGLIASNDTNTLITYLKAGGSRFDKHDVPLLGWIAMYGNVEMAQEVINATDYNVKEWRNRCGPALEYAAMSNRLNMCKLLVSKGADPNFKPTQNWNNATEMASTYGALDVLRYFIEECHAKIGKSHLVAARNGQINVIDYLHKERNIGFNSFNAEGVEYGTSMLYEAIRCNRTDVFLWFNEAGFDVSEKTEGKYTPFEYACRCGRTDFVDFYLAKGEHLSERTIMFLLEKGCCDYVLDNTTVLVENIIFSAIIKYDNTNYLQKAVSKLKIDINGFHKIGNDDDTTFCYTAIQYNSHNTLSWLLSHGVSLDTKRANWCSAFEYACNCGALDCAKLIQSNSIVVLGYAPYLAIYNGKENIIKWLLSLKNGNVPLVDAKTYNGTWGTLLSYAAATGNLKMCSLLMSFGADPNYKPDEKTWSAVERAAVKNKVEVLKYFLEEVKANVGQAPYAAMINESIECLKYFIEERGIGADYCDVDGTPLLADAAGYGKIKSVEYLLRQGASVDFAPMNKDGSRKYSAMERAINAKHVEIVQMLKSVRGNNVINPPIKVGFRDSIGHSSSSKSFVLRVENTSSGAVHVNIFRNGDEIKHYDGIVGGGTSEYGWLELDRSFAPGDKGMIKVHEYARKCYYEFTQDDKLSLRFDD